MPLKRRIAALNRVNVLRAYLGLPEKNLDKTLRPRKPRQIDEPVQQPSSENDSAISVYSQESEAEQTHSDSSEDDSTDEQTASESDQVAEEQVWKDPYAYLDDPSQLSEVEQCP
jgi:predicted lipid-binding transport protein (Tim44 family)